MMKQSNPQRIKIGSKEFLVHKLGIGEPVLLLHGFPETHLMWQPIAELLAMEFTVIFIDLPGYDYDGSSDFISDNRAYSKKSLAKEMIALMKALAFDQFHVAGHDRGGRIAFRMAIDFPRQIKSVVFLDIAPSLQVWEFADNNFSLAFWPWSLLAQPAPFPEQLVLASPHSIVDHALQEWGTPESAFSYHIREAYVDALRNPQNVHAICEEFRASATVDRIDDDTDFKVGLKIICPVLVLWSKSGPVNTWYEKQGGPLVLWGLWGNYVEGYPIEGGHFFPEEMPEQTAGILQRFFKNHI